MIGLPGLGRPCPADSARGARRAGGPGASGESRIRSSELGSDHRAAAARARRGRPGVGPLGSRRRGLRLTVTGARYRDSCDRGARGGSDRKFRRDRTVRPVPRTRGFKARPAAAGRAWGHGPGPRRITRLDAGRPPVGRPPGRDGDGTGWPGAGPGSLPIIHRIGRSPRALSHRPTVTAGAPAPGRGRGGSGTPVGPGRAPGRPTGWSGSAALRRSRSGPGTAALRLAAGRPIAQRPGPVTVTPARAGPGGAAGRAPGLSAVTVP
eukprot:761537-Hanusia_phi.AAC.1